MLRSDLLDFSDAYIAREFIDTRNRFLAFKNYAPFISYISKINNLLISNAEGLDIVMPVYNLLEYSKNYKKTTGSLWHYYRDESNNPPLNDDDTPTVNYNADPITNPESFKYKNNITGKTSNANQENGENTVQGNTKIKKTVVPLKYLSNFLRTLDIALINCEVSLTLTWSENCILTDITIQTARAAQVDNPARDIIDAPTNATFKITDTKLYVPVVTSSTKDDNDYLKSGFKRTI